MKSGYQPVSIWPMTESKYKLVLQSHKLLEEKLKSAKDLLSWAALISERAHYTEDDLTCIDPNCCGQKLDTHEEIKESLKSWLEDYQAWEKSEKG